jgi:hypothetical protein
MPNRPFKSQLLRCFPDARIETYRLGDGRERHQVYTPRQILGYGATHASAWKAAWLLSQKPSSMRMMHDASFHAPLRAARRRTGAEA